MMFHYEAIRELKKKNICSKISDVHGEWDMVEM